MVLLTALLGMLHQALPVHRAASWTWEIRSSAPSFTPERNWRTLMALDSLPDDSGTTWTFQVRDSATQSGDTAKLRVPRSGLQRWTRTSRFLPWEPEPAASANITWGTSIAPSDSAKWGRAFFAQDPQSILSLTRKSDAYAWPTIAWSHAELSGTVDFPEVRFQEGLGMTFSRLPTLGSEEGFWDWRLVRMDGHAPQGLPAWGPWKLPTAESRLSWEWESTTTQIPSNIGPGPQTPIKLWRQILVSWEVSALSDSAGWSRRKIVESLQFPADSTATPQLRTFALRANLATGERPEFHEQSESTDMLVWRHWSDSVFSSSFQRHRYFRSVSAAGGPLRTSSSRTFALAHLDGICDTMHILSTSSEGMGGQSTTELKIRLLSENGTTLRSRTAGVEGRTHARSASRLDLRSISREHPGAILRWVDPTGSSGTCTVSRFLSLPRRGLVQVEIQLPDGPRSGVLLPF